MTDTSIATRVDRLDQTVSLLSTDVAGVKVQLGALAGGQANILDELKAQARSRPGVASILPWVMAALGFVSIVGGALVVPQLARISAIEQSQHESAPRREELRAQVAILCHDALAAGKGCEH